MQTNGMIMQGMRDLLLGNHQEMVRLLFIKMDGDGHMHDMSEELCNIMLQNERCLSER